MQYLLHCLNTILYKLDKMDLNYIFANTHWSTNALFGSRKQLLTICYSNCIGLLASILCNVKFQC